MQFPLGPVVAPRQQSVVFNSATNHIGATSQTNCKDSLTQLQSLGCGLQGRCCAYGSGMFKVQGPSGLLLGSRAWA